MGEWCPIHKCNFGTSRCVCDPPFKLFPFPTERKNSKGRQEWIDLINRSDLNTGESWAPKSHSRVCSKHFPDGRPTAEHPNPIENLILEPIEKPKRGKMFQSRRKSQVPRSLYRLPDSVVDVDIVDSESDSMEFIENQNGNENNICKNDTVASGAIQNLGLNRTVSFTVHVYMHGNQFTNLFRFLTLADKIDPGSFRPDSCSPWVVSPR